MEQKRLKEQVRNEYLSGGGSYRSLAERYGCSASTIHRLVMGSKNKETKRRATKIEGWVQRASGADQAMPTEVSELQEELRMARLKIELLEAMIDVADEQMGANIRKKAGARQS
jgi:transposase-like protein